MNQLLAITNFTTNFATNTFRTTFRAINVARNRVVKGYD